MPAPIEKTRAFGPWTGTLLIVASMVGTGVFTTTGLLLSNIHSIPAVLVCWAGGGLLALAGALSYAELAGALRENGGEFLFLSRIYHPMLGFVAGTVSLVVGFSAPIAASALAFSLYVRKVFPSAPGDLLAVLVVVGLATVHAWRVREGGRFQNAFTAAKVLLIAVFVLAGCWSMDMDRIAVMPRVGLAEAVFSPAFAVGLVLVSFAYTGWGASIYIAGEIENPQRNLPVSLVAGTSIVTILYLGLNFVFLGAVPVENLSGVVEVGHVAAVGLFGEASARAFSAMIAVGLISTIGAYVMTGPRVYEAMGETFSRLKFLAGRMPGRGPVPAILLQTGAALLMMTAPGFEALLTYIGFTLSIFAGLTVLGVFVLRAREPDLPRPYRVWGYPVTPLFFVAVTAWTIWHSITERPSIALAGFGTLAAACLLYVWSTRPAGD